MLDGPHDTAPEATCPVCGGPGDGFMRHERAIAHAQYVCAASHIWTTKWLVSA